ncbi:MAG TPA: glycosyltransferase [Geobacteraceae bacterium]
MTLLFWLGLATLASYLVLGLDLLIGNRSVRLLRDTRSALSPAPPKVSVVVAARNEERNIRAALQSLLALDYPDYELLVVNDRSTDRTGTFLAEQAAKDSCLRVITVSELPAGWLGKNHALWLGSRQATGELLLFTDADIVMEPDTLRRAVTLLQDQQLDHLAITPSMTMPTTLLAMFGAAFIIFFSLFARPWKARDPRSRCHIGIGAFNLIRSATYRAVGGHEAIRLRPDDDMKLGKLVKKGGFRQDVVYGPDFLSVEWYASLGEVVRGLEKNAFAGCDYRVSFALLGAGFHLVGTVWPYLAVVLTTGATRLVYLAVVALLTLLFMDSARFHGAKRWHAVGFPFCTALFVWIILRTMVLNLAHGGITWRGTFYPLREMKANRV